MVQVEVHNQYMHKLGDSFEKMWKFMDGSNYECINLATRQKISAAEFLQCTHCHAPDTFTGEDMAFQGYGQVIFIPKEREGALQKVTQRECKICQTSQNV